uniref:Uncharacterized protein n=1 Tax=Mus musculus TaxID=10090 RepID=Q3UHS1_MOUSE|nr:unnamed protein product [Mus musculus]
MLGADSRRCAHGGKVPAWGCRGGRGRATPSGACAGSRAARRSRKRCARGAGAAARAQPGSAGPSRCDPRSLRHCLRGRQGCAATGPVRPRSAKAVRQREAVIRERRGPAAAGGCRTLGCGPG